jgi:hypothetical protein
MIIYMVSIVFNGLLRGSMHGLTPSNLPCSGCLAIGQCIRIGTIEQGLEGVIWRYRVICGKDITWCILARVHCGGAIYGVIYGLDAKQSEITTSFL